MLLRLTLVHGVGRVATADELLLMLLSLLVVVGLCIALITAVVAVAAARVTPAASTPLVGARASTASAAFVGGRGLRMEQGGVVWHTVEVCRLEGPGCLGVPGCGCRLQEASVRVKWRLNTKIMNT